MEGLNIRALSKMLADEVPVYNSSPPKKKTTLNPTKKDPF